MATVTRTSAGEWKGTGPPKRLAEGAPIDPPKEHGEQQCGEHGPGEEPPSLTLHRASALLTKSFRSNT